MSTSVVIAGAGPVGLMLACELGLMGVQATVLERDRAVRGDSPGYTLHARSADLLDRRGLMDSVWADEPVIWPRVPFSNIWIDLTPVIDWEYSLIFPQTRTEAILAARAAQLGADIRRGSEVIGLDQDGDGVTVRVRTGTEQQQLRCRYLVGCDGGDSAVRALAGIEAPATGMPWYGVLADFEEIGDDWEWASPNYPGGLFAVLPHPDGSGLLRLMAIEFDAVPPGGGGPPTARELHECVRRVTGHDFRLAEEPRWICRYAGATRLAERYRSGNVFLAGDAAHVHYFSAGHGLNTGLQDAANLGWKLAAELRGWAPTELLDTYHGERYPVGRRACVYTQAQMALHHPHDRAGPLREVFQELMQFDDVQRQLAGAITDAKYPMPAAGAGAHPLIGRQVPHVPLATAGGAGSVAAVLRSGRGVVFDLSLGAQDMADMAGWTGRVDVVAAQPSEAIGATAVLVRPDGYVAWADTTGKDAEGLTAALRTWFGPRATGTCEAAGAGEGFRTRAALEV